ncbi:response regulator transcription factor [Paraburkholderia hospita]|jgi:DNA-binding CsgD family transcriptional regulator
MKPLTQREKQIVLLIGNGLRGDQIAASLKISPQTVRKHRANIAQKLGLSTTVQLVSYAVTVAQSSSMNPFPHHCCNTRQT